MRKIHYMAQEFGKYRIFVVDDHVVATTLALVLSSKGFNARPFFTPGDALQAALLESPDLLISEVIMPQISGIELAAQILDRHPNCKIMLLSGSPETFGLLKMARSHGHHVEVLPKPLPTDYLIARVEEMLKSTSPAAS